VETLIKESRDETKREMQSTNIRIEYLFEDYKKQADSYARSIDLKVSEQVSKLDSSVGVLQQLNFKFTHFAESFKHFAEVFDNSFESVRRRNLNDLKFAFDKSDYFANLATIRTWREYDPFFDIYAAYQTRWRKDNKLRSDILEVNGRKVDLQHLSFEKFGELNNAFREIKKFMETAETLCSSKVQNVYFPSFYLNKEDFITKLGFMKPHVFDFLDFVQHMDIVNGNCTGLMRKDRQR
jgi:hypothetical protein